MTEQSPTLGALATQLAGPVIVALVGVAMLIWSWGTWPDPVIDFGRELYVPWQLSEGQVLYRDIVSYFNGPLSPYVHAMLFKLTGPSLRVIVIFNLAIIAALTAMLYWLIAQAAGPLAATAAGVAFLGMFAFSQYSPTGNYNFVCPYSYELSHGITLTVAALCCLHLWARGGHAGWLIGTGVLLGLVFLTKAEIFFAAAAAIAAGFVATVWVQRPDAARGLTDLGLLLGAAFAPVLIAVTLLSLAMPVGAAVRGVAGAWAWVNDSELLALPYFKEIAGTRNPLASIRNILVSGFVYLLLFVPAALLGMGIGQERLARIVVPAVVSVPILVLGIWFWMKINWNLLVQPVPVFLLIAMGTIAYVLVTRREQGVRQILPLMLVVWSGAMLAKIPLNVHITHYGFALAMPATLIMIAILVGWLPQIVDRFHGNGHVVRGVALAALLVSLYAHIRWTQWMFSTRTETIGVGADRFRSDRRAIAIKGVLDELARSARPGDTLVVAPEGLFINYLARRVNPTGQLNFTPPALIMYREAAMLAALKKHPPDWIVLTSVDSSEYGARFFGADYAKALGAWIVANYETVKPYPVEVQPRSMFVIQLLRKKPVGIQPS